MNLKEEKKIGSKEKILKNPFQVFLVSKTYIFIHGKKNLDKIERPLAARGGGGKALADAPAKNVSFVLTNDRC